MCVRIFGSLFVMESFFFRLGLISSSVSPKIIPKVFFNILLLLAAGVAVVMASSISTILFYVMPSTNRAHTVQSTLSHGVWNKT